jgi:DNA-binding XRE family transcriptional regulator
MGGYFWHHNEIETLKRMWPLHSLEEIYAALPNRSRHAINNMAAYRKIKRFPEARRHRGRKAVKAPPIIKQLRRMREGQGLTREQLAKKVGVPFITIAKWESCWNKPRFDMLLAWAQALGYEIGLRQVNFRIAKNAKAA